MIGMPASGKSTVGIILAKALGYDFIDGDLLIQMEEEAMRHLQEIGTIVYLQMDLDMALDRLHDPKKRGVVLEEGETIETLYYKRLPLYEKYAEITVNERGHALEDLVIQILTKLHGH